MKPHSPLSDRRLSLLSIVGFLSLTGALVIAHLNPATGYELSIYRATPITFWIGIAIAFISSLTVSFWPENGWYRVIGTVLGGLSSVTVVSLPIIRGYYSAGIHDSVTHVGWARELVAGSMDPLDLLYPAIHTIAAFIQSLTGLTIWHSMFLVPVLIVVVFLVFTPLVVQELLTGNLATTVGAFSAFLLIPIHLLANTITAHPSSQTILFTPVLLFLLIRFVRSTAVRRLHGIFSPVGVALLLTVLASILYHPQQALNVLILLTTITLVQYAVNSRGAVRWPRHRRTYSVTGVALLAYLGWIFKEPAVISIAQGGVESLLGYVTGSPPQAGSSVVTQASSLQAIGASLPIIFVKLFFVSTVFVILTVIVLLAAFSDTFRQSQVRVDSTSVVRYFGIGLIAMLPVFGVYFFGNIATHYFRQAGFMLLIGTVLGAVGIAYGTQIASNTRLKTAARLLLIGGFGVMLLLSMMVIHDSPYINKANQQVTEARVSGYETTFTMTNESAVMAGVGQEPQRYYDSLVSTSDNDRRDRNVNSSEIRRLQELRDREWYLAMHNNTYGREVGAYEEYRFTRADLRSVDQQVGVNRVHSNGDMDLYYVLPSV
ncbi:hypothetical protein BRC91_11765 [Halobacteriales archaeon QS_4_62_28]|nr:MAG: hypothetical protein BRC91_11765 [Halobacteriales archaeon QS_4_62_28]